MRVSYKYNEQDVIMDDSWPVICADEFTREILETMQAVETALLHGDVTQSPVRRVLDFLGDDIDELQILPDETIN